MGEPALQQESISEIIQRVLIDNKAEDMRVLNLKGQTSIADELVIVTSRSSRHMKALADHVYLALKHKTPVKVEGDGNSQWVVVDAFDTVVHLFTKEARQLYNLEKLWDMPIITPTQPE